MRGFVEKVIKNISKLSDEQVKQVLLEVSIGHELLSSVLDSEPNGIVIVDSSWKVQQTNKAADRLLFSGNTDDSKFDEDEIWKCITESEVGDFIKKAAEENRTNTAEEFSLQGSDGSVRFVIVSIIPFLMDEKVYGNIIKIEDITQKRTKEIFQRRMENMQGLTNLAAGMAHEIKNPLGAISIHVQLIQKIIQKKRESDGLLPEKKFLENHLDIVNQEIENLNKLVMDFLFAVRPVKAEFKLSQAEKIIEDLINFLKPEFNEDGVDISSNLQENEIRLLIDDKLFREVVLNIVQNAFQAVKSKAESAEKGFSGKVEISSMVKSDRYQIKIQDNGCGMDEETVSRIFEPYFTTKANGTGLGMTMAYKIIKEFNGDISVKSEKGNGTEFTIELPVPQAETKLLKQDL